MTSQFSQLCQWNLFSASFRMFIFLLKVIHIFHIAPKDPELSDLAQHSSSSCLFPLHFPGHLGWPLVIWKLLCSLRAYFIGVHILDFKFCPILTLPSVRQVSTPRLCPSPLFTFTLSAHQLAQADLELSLCSVAQITLDPPPPPAREHLGSWTCAPRPGHLACFV